MSINVRFPMKERTRRSGRSKRTKAHSIGVISDTHGLVRPEAIKALMGVELIVHAGDVGNPEVLTALQAVAPVVAVRGNIDRENGRKSCPRQRWSGLANACFMFSTISINST